MKKATAIIHLPASVCEVSTAQKLREVKGIYSANMIRAQQVVIKYNSKKYTTRDLFKQAQIARVAKSFVSVEVEELEEMESPIELDETLEPIEITETPDYE
jgi:hypothetical protein